MKAKLIFSPRVYGNAHPLMPPLGISILARHIRTAGHRCDLDDLDIKVFRDKNIDLRIFNDTERMNRYLFRGKDDEEIVKAGEAMLRMSPVGDAEIAAFSIVDPIGYCTSSTTLVLAKMMKERYDIPVAVGGLFNKQNAEFFTKTPQVDYAFVGYGEEGFRVLLDSLEKKTESLISAPGLVTTLGGREVYNHHQQNVCKFPDFDGLPMEMYRFNLGEYTQGRYNSRPITVLPYYFMNGCPNDCAFCGQSIKGLPFESKEPDLIAEELELLSVGHRTRHFCFLNTTLNFSKRFVDKLVESIAERGLDIMWTDSANFRHLTRESIADLRKSGLVRALFGMESGSQKVLDYINKRVDVSSLTGLLKASHDENIWNEVYLIAGLPYESAEDVEHTIRFVKSNAEYLNFVHLNRFRLIDSAMTEDPGRFGLANISFIGDKKTNCSEYYTNRFDESRGLPWEEKTKQIERSFQAVQEAILKTKVLNNHKYSISNLQLIYSLFENHGTITDVEKDYVEIQATRSPK